MVSPADRSPSEASPNPVDQDEGSVQTAMSTAARSPSPATASAKGGSVQTAPADRSPPEVSPNFEAMNVVELRVECALRGLNRKGGKETLIARLQSGAGNSQTGMYFNSSKSYSFFK